MLSPLPATADFVPAGDSVENVQPETNEVSTGSTLPEAIYKEPDFPLTDTAVSMETNDDAVVSADTDVDAGVDAVFVTNDTVDTVNVTDSPDPMTPEPSNTPENPKDEKKPAAPIFPYESLSAGKLPDGSHVIVLLATGTKDEQRNNPKNYLVLLVAPDGSIKIGTVTKIEAPTRREQILKFKIDGKDTELVLDVALASYDGQKVEKPTLDEKAQEKILQAAKIKITEIVKKDGYVYLYFTKEGDKTSYVLRFPFPKGFKDIKQEEVKDNPLGTIKITVTVTGDDGKEKVNDVFYIDPATGIMTQTLEDGKETNQVLNMLAVAPPKK